MATPQFLHFFNKNKINVSTLLQWRYLKMSAVSKLSMVSSIDFCKLQTHRNLLDNNLPIMLTLRSTNASWCHNVFTNFFTNNLIWCLFDRSRVLTIHTLAYAHCPDLSVQKFSKQKQAASWAEQIFFSEHGCGSRYVDCLEATALLQCRQRMRCFESGSCPYCCTPMHARCCCCCTTVLG